MASYLRAENKALRDELLTLRFITKCRRVNRLKSKKQKRNTPTQLELFN